MAQTRSIYMATTGIAPDKTVGEIIALLAQAGAHQIQMQYDAGRVNALVFSLKLNDELLGYRLPCRVDRVHEQLKRTGRGDRSLDQARRTAWRQIFRWVQAQLALVETGQVQSQEAFMAYLLWNKRQTLWELIADKGVKALPAPPK